jgi:hypothetical protein
MKGGEAHDQVPFQTAARKDKNLITAARVEPDLRI